MKNITEEQQTSVQDVLIHLHQLKNVMAKTVQVMRDCDYTEMTLHAHELDNARLTIRNWINFLSEEEVRKKMNKVILSGRLGNNPRRVSDTHTVVEFSLATTSFKNGEKKTTWHQIVTFNKTAENVERFLEKGSAVILEGTIDNNRYENKEGRNVTISKVIAFNVEFLDKTHAAPEPKPKNLGHAVSAPDDYDNEEMPF